jgi:hypothetical protein
MGMRLGTDRKFLGDILDIKMELVEDNERDGHPKSNQTEVNIASLLIWSKMTISSHKD